MKNPTNRFQPSPYDPQRLLNAVREIAALANPRHPSAVSQRGFDSTRVHSAHPTLPPARHIATRLKLCWHEVLRLAHLPPRSQRQALGRALGTKKTTLDNDQIATALRIIAKRMNTKTLTPSQYRRERSRLLKANHRHWLHGTHFTLPTDNQIQVTAGSWDQALELAGLTRRPVTGGFQGTKPTPIVELLTRCYATHGTQPTIHELELFARANEIPMPRLKGRPYVLYIAEWKASRREHSLPAPDGPPPKNKRPDYTANAGTTRNGRRHHSWSRKECITAVARYLHNIPAGTRPTQRGYADWRATQTDNLPWPSAIGRQGGWTAITHAVLDRPEQSESFGSSPRG